MGEEQATEDLPEKIRRVAKAVGLVWSEDYSRYAHLLLVDAADEIERLRADHERRVTELLEANGREVERRRRAEAELARVKATVRIAVHDLRYAHYAEGYPMNLPRISRRLDAALRDPAP